MIDPIVMYVGNRNPSLADTVTSGGVAQNINGKSLTFKMRAITSQTLKVNAAATNLDVDASTRGQWRYDWLAADVDTAGFFLAWLEVVGGGKAQDVPEFLIQFLPHTPATTAYVQREELKATLNLKSTFANQDIDRAVLAASRAIDKVTGRRFWLDADAAQVRHYTPSSRRIVKIDDLAELTSLQVDQGADGVFEETWTLNTEFLLEPLNAAVDGWPWEYIEAHPAGSRSFPAYPRSVKVTGKFGWLATPDPIRDATTILAHTLLKRKREAAFGVVALGADGAAVRIARTDPHIQLLLEPYNRRKTR